MSEHDIAMIHRRSAHISGDLRTLTRDYLRAAQRIRDLEDALSAVRENNTRLAIELNRLQSELMRRESY